MDRNITKTQDSTSKVFLQLIVFGYAQSIATGFGKTNKHRGRKIEKNN
jgi:hypothetical protein